MKTQRNAVLVLVCCAALSAGAARAGECDRSGPVTPHPVVANPADLTPPGAPVVTDMVVRREDAPPKVKCITIGTIGLTITPPTDDRSPAEALGYVVRHVSGTLVEGAFMDGVGPENPYRLVDGMLWINFADDADRRLEAEFTVAAVDEAGNEGPESEAVEIVSAGSDGWGCASAAGSGLNLLPALALLLWRRRRSQRIAAH